MKQKDVPRFTQVEAGLAPILIVILIAAVASLGRFLIYAMGGDDDIPRDFMKRFIAIYNHN